MNVVLDLQEKLRTNTAAIGRLSMAIAQHPESPAAKANLRSLRKLQSSLTDAYVQAVREMGVDVCKYRLLENNPSARTLSKALAGFQDAFSTVFEVLRSGQPMNRKALTRETLRLTDLRVAYTFPGSFGVVLTVPRDRLIFDDWPTKAEMKPLRRCSKWQELSRQVKYRGLLVNLGEHR